MEGTLSGLNGPCVLLHVEEVFTQERVLAPSPNLRTVVLPAFNKILEHLLKIKLAEIPSVLLMEGILNGLPGPLVQ
jgi:hypothetical protein